MQTEEIPPEGPIMCDTGTQTEAHPVDRHINRAYEWNEWELRRTAVRQANCRTNRKRSSMQTNLSHMRRETVNQAFPPRDITCQSAKDAGTSMSTPLVYVSELRGHKVSRATKTDLTVDETLSFVRK